MQILLGESWPFRLVKCCEAEAFPSFDPVHLSFSPPAESIHGHPSVFLETERSHGPKASQQSCETKSEGGREVGGGRSVSVTSEESEMSVCSLSQLGNTIANSEWEGH